MVLRPLEAAAPWLPNRQWRALAMLGGTSVLSYLQPASAVAPAAFWGDRVLLGAGGATSLASVQLGSDEILNDTFVALPPADFVLLELYVPARCFTCTGLLPEFERAAMALRHLGGEVPPVLAASLDCSRFPGLCRRFNSSHLEPYGALMMREPAHGPLPPEDWAGAWPTSVVVLAERRELMAGPPSVPAHWHLQGRYSTEHLLAWAAARLASLPPSTTAASRAAQALRALQLPPEKEFRLAALHASGLVGQQSDHGCFCRQQSWTRCSGGFYGHWRTCREVHGCVAGLNICRTHSPCAAGGEDTCNPRNETTFPPELRPRGADVELAAALLLHSVWEQAEFPLLSGFSRKLSVRGEKRRKALMDMLMIFCKWFPRDSIDLGQEILEEAAISVEGGSQRGVGGAGRRLRESGRHCRVSLCKLRSLLRRRWDELTEPVPGRRALRIRWRHLEARWQLCGLRWAAWQRHRWQQCRGTFPGTRQLPCGLWVLLHRVFAELVAVDSIWSAVVDISAAASRSKRGKAWRELGARFAVDTTRAFLAEFLPCPACVRSLLSIPFTSDHIHTKRDAVLWLWRTHNYISRLVVEQPWQQRAFETDPAFPPTHSWPPAALCPACVRAAAPALGAVAGTPASGRARVASFDMAASEGLGASVHRETDWDLDAVFHFLVEFYITGSTTGFERNVTVGNKTAKDLVSLALPAAGSPIAGRVRRTRPLRPRPDWLVVAWGASLAGATLAALWCCPFAAGRLWTCRSLALPRARAAETRGLL